MSVGHISRAVELAGIPTVIIAAAPFETKLLSMSPSRLVITEQIMGRPLGMPGDKDHQTRALNTALDLLMETKEGNRVIRMPST